MKSTAAPGVPLIPVRDLFRNSERSGYALSPDGRYLSWLQPWETRLNVHVQAVAGGPVVRVTEDRARDIRSYFWTGGGRIAWVQDNGGDENFRLYSVRADGTDRRDLTPFDEVQVRIVSDLKRRSPEILASHNHRDKRVFDVYRIDTETGKSVLVAENPGNIDQWVPDHEGRLRVAVTTDGVNRSLLYRPDDSAAFTTVKTTTFRETLAPLFFSFDNRSLYASSNLGRDRQAIVRLDPATGQELDLLFAHPEVDVGDLIASEARQRVVGVAFEADLPETFFWDPERRALQEELERRLPGERVSVTGASLDERRLIVSTFGDRTRGAAYFFDRDSGELRKLADRAPWLNAEHLAPVQPIRFTSRDGLTLPGYLTLPVGLEPRGLPLVVLPHGGPWARDSWGFDPEVQLLANRGYAVLQINFRGSTGFGRAFWEASFKQWGRTMQNDLTDGVQWLAAQGTIDPQRVAIYGGSYGGYAALAGLAFTPEVYAAGISYVGVSNLFTLLASLPPYWENYRRMLYEMVGDPEAEAELVRAASPLFAAENIRAPLLILQGQNDPRVKPAESEQIVAALKARGIDVPYILKANEGHGFGNEENRFYAYAAIEQFLARHLGGRAEGGVVIPELN